MGGSRGLVEWFVSCFLRPFLSLLIIRILTSITAGIDWAALPAGATVVDVGGGIGTTCLMLAEAFCRGRDGRDGGLKFVVQDREAVVGLGVKVRRFLWFPLFFYFSVFSSCLAVSQAVVTAA